MEPLAPWRLWTQVIAVSMFVLIAMLRPWPLARIVALCIGVLVGYGVAQDQITARLCPEYFTIAHPPIEGLTDPTTLGLAWGFLGSWWGGLILGMSLAATATFGSAPPVPMVKLRGPLIGLVMFVACVSLMCGVSAWYNGRLLNVAIGEPWSQVVPAERQRMLLVVACTHMGSYGSAIIGSVVVCLWVARMRKRGQGRQL